MKDMLLAPKEAGIRRRGFGSMQALPLLFFVGNTRIHSAIVAVCQVGNFWLSGLHVVAVTNLFQCRLGAAALSLARYLSSSAPSIRARLVGPWAQIHSATVVCSGLCTFLITHKLKRLSV